MPSPELWRIVPSLPEVLASTRGRVMVIPKLGPNPQGGQRHYQARARNGSWDGDRFLLVYRGKSYKVARLVCEAFNGPPPSSDSVCMHINENARNNEPSNLKWGTQKENLNAPGFLEYCRARTGDNSPTIKGRKNKAA